MCSTEINDALLQYITREKGLTWENAKTNGDNYTSFIYISYKWTNLWSTKKKAKGGLGNAFYPFRKPAQELMLTYNPTYNQNLFILVKEIQTYWFLWKDWSRSNAKLQVYWPKYSRLWIGTLHGGLFCLFLGIKKNCLCLLFIFSWIQNNPLCIAISVEHTVVVSGVSINVWYWFLQKDEKMMPPFFYLNPLESCQCGKRRDPLSNEMVVVYQYHRQAHKQCHFVVTKWITCCALTSIKKLSPGALMRAVS